VSSEDSRPTDNRRRSHTMAPHAESAPFTNGSKTPSVIRIPGDPEAPPEGQPQPPKDYYYTYDNRDGYTPETLGPGWEYTVAEHILWAPRKIRVASIGAGASGIMMCYKKEKEFGDDIDLVVYDREYGEMF
jgi:hypothetical protein